VRERYAVTSTRRFDHRRREPRSRATDVALAARVTGYRPNVNSCAGNVPALTVEPARFTPTP